MNTLEGVGKIQCSNCGNVVSIDGSDIDVEMVSSDERKMGAEIFYEGRLDAICPKCYQSFEIVYEASEYPAGALNYSDTEILGGDLVRGFEDIDVSFGEEVYSYEEQSNLYLPKKNEIVTNLNLGVSHLISELSKTPEILYRLDPRKFEELIAHIFSKHGFMVELTKRTRDGGRDIIAISNILEIRAKYLIECKRYAPNNPVRVDLVRNLYGVQIAEGANKSILATTSYFTPDAMNFAKVQNTTEWAMDLKGFDDIISWVRQIQLSS